MSYILCVYVSVPAARVLSFYPPNSRVVTFDLFARDVSSVIPGYSRQNHILVPYHEIKQAVKAHGELGSRRYEMFLGEKSPRPISLLGEDEEEEDTTQVVWNDEWEDPPPVNFPKIWVQRPVRNRPQIQDQDQRRSRFREIMGSLDEDYRLPYPPAA